MTFNQIAKDCLQVLLTVLMCFLNNLITKIKSIKIFKVFCFIN